MIDNAFTLRTKGFSVAGSAGVERWKRPGDTIRRKSTAKNTPRMISAIKPKIDNRRGGSSTIGVSSGSCAVDLFHDRCGTASAMEFGLGRKMGNLSKNFTETIATVAAHKVASSAVPTMAVGLVEPDAARMAMAVIGINCTELVLIARKVHIAFVATPGCGLSVSRSRIARKPRGVAALPRPSMFAAMFMTIDPIAG